MSLEEAYRMVSMNLEYTPNGWRWVIDTHRPYGCVLGYELHNSPEGALDELRGFLRYFSENVLKSGDTIRAYVNKHIPNKKENDD